MKHPDTKTESHRLKIISLITNKRKQEERKKERRWEEGRMEEKERKEERKEEGRRKEERKEERGGRRRRQGKRETEERAEKREINICPGNSLLGRIIIHPRTERKKNKSTTDVPHIIFPISSLKISFVF